MQESIVISVRHGISLDCNRFSERGTPFPIRRASPAGTGASWMYPPYLQPLRSLLSACSVHTLTYTGMVRPLQIDRVRRRRLEGL